MTPLRAAAAARVVMILATLWPSPTLAGRNKRDRSPAAPGTAWIQLHTGLTFGDSLLLTDGNVLFESVGSVRPVLGLNVFYRTERFDLGGVVEALGSFDIAGKKATHPVGGQLRVAADVRWRYISESWGALFLRLTPGLMFFNHREFVRAQLNAIETGEQVVTGVDTLTLGFSMGLDFGMMFYLSPRFAISAHMEFVTGTSSVDTPGDSMDYGVSRGLFTVGLEWRL